MANAAQDARQFFEQARWGTDPTCPRCGCGRCGALRGTAGERYIWKCYGCLQFFTVRTGTFLEGSRVDLATWRLVIVGRWIDNSALRCSREIGYSYKTTWAMLHRLRFAASPSGEPWLQSLMAQYVSPVALRR